MANGIVLNIDTTKSEFQNPMVQLRQGDGNYQSLSVTATSNGEPFDLTGWTITFMGTTAGGFKIVDTASVVTNASQGKFTYTPTKAWGQDQGEFKNAYFKFVKTDETASSASFRVNVLDAVDLTAEEAKDYISVVDVMIDQVKTDMDSKLADTKKTLSDTQTQANTVQSNVNDLNANVNDLKQQNNNIRTSDNTWTGSNNFTKEVNLGNNISTTSDDSMVNGGGNDGSLAMVKKQLSTPFIAVGSNIPFKVKRSNDKSTNITPFDVFTDLLTVNTDGTTLVGDAQVPLAKDSTVLHNTGNETATGDKTFTGLTSVSNAVSINTKTANVTSKGLSVNFIETAFGVEVNITESGNTTLPANDAWGVLGNIPATISAPKQSIFTSANVTSTIGGVTRTNFLLILSFNPNREIDYRLILTRENDNTTTYVPVFRTWLSTNWFK